MNNPCSSSETVKHVENALTQSDLSKQTRAAQHYLSDSAIKRINTTDSQSHFAEDKFRTILFADIVDFTSLCESKSSYDVVQLLNRYFDRMVEVLVKYDATIDKFIGDAIFASFGRQEDGAHRAVCAAHEMIQILPSLSSQLGTDVHVRIGINSGHVILGDIGSHLYRRDFTLIGDNVNIAQRLESMAKTDSILISKATYELIHKNVTVCNKQVLQLKGKKKKIDAYTITSVKPYFPSEPIPAKGKVSVQ
jgi:adenylate cyclase